MTKDLFIFFFSRYPYPAFFGSVPRPSGYGIVLLPIPRGTPSSNSPSGEDRPTRTLFPIVWKETSPAKGSSITSSPLGSVRHHFFRSISSDTFPLSATVVNRNCGTPIPPPYG